MKVFLKRVFYSLIVSFIILNIISNSLSNQLEEMGSLHYKNSYLADAAIMCMQLYMVNPTPINKKTCLLIENSIQKNNEEINSFALASIYLNYIHKN